MSVCLGLDGVCLFDSCALTGVGQVYAVGVTLFAVSCLVNFLANNWTIFRILDYGLPFHYYDPYATMTSGGFTWAGVAYFLHVALVFATLSVLALQRKDLVSWSTTIGQGGRNRWTTKR